MISLLGKSAEISRFRCHNAEPAIQPERQRRCRWYPSHVARRRPVNGIPFGVNRPADADRSILSTMKIATGKVVGGKVVLEGAAFEEGTSVTVLARDEKGDITVTPEEEAELLLAIAEADRGEMVSAEEVLAKLARRRG